jgi:hypothetical protein
MPDINSLTDRVPRLHNATPRHWQRVRDQYLSQKTASSRALYSIVQVTTSAGRVTYMMSANSFIEPRALNWLERRCVVDHTRSPPPSQRAFFHLIPLQVRVGSCSRSSCELHLDREAVSTTQPEPVAFKEQIIAKGARRTKVFIGTQASDCFRSCTATKAETAGDISALST